ncbi:ABC transporter ATP-binding protein, partial [Falsiroseomonas oryzae]|uniref:ABC transporter ATP-binding protein n=1 Tax=Falsiroseomonas oryzae TaxID=2766473 RepID=UPI0022EA5775
MSGPALEVRGLRTAFRTRAGDLVALDDVSFSLHAQETLALVGESGCGKSLTALSVMRLVPPPGRIAAGAVLLDGEDLTALPETAMARLRGDRISMIFQEPMTSLNPVMTVGDQVAESLILHRGLSRTAARRRAVELLDLVRIADPQRRIDDYPHRLSGGMRQRVMIAMALALEPRVLIADEPTTALDVTIQAQILELLRAMQRSLGMGLLLITHDLGVVAQLADRVAVMYAGRIVEEASVTDLFDHPTHPYTQGLFGATPAREQVRARLREIPGMVPSLAARPPGCAFAARCAVAEPG